MTTPLPTVTEVLAATRHHGSTARGWRGLARDLRASGMSADADACEAVAGKLDATGELWGGPATDRVGPCPWCAVMMPIGDEHPLIERCCDLCAEKPFDELARRSPVMAGRYLATVAKLGETE